MTLMRGGTIKPPHQGWIGTAQLRSSDPVSAQRGTRLCIMTNPDTRDAPLHPSALHVPFPAEPRRSQGVIRRG